VSDLSEVYLQRARKNLQGVSRAEFVQAAAEELPFQAGRFDAVISVYLFHELPLEVRKKVLSEKVRVTRAGGLIAAVDSLQLHDLPEVASVLEQFPLDFHEPFYRNYIENPLEDLFLESGIHSVERSTGFVSKCVSGLTFASQL
jgi:ubiquinone/menaquinone biosynthesis C-methylase UbiE